MKDTEVNHKSKSSHSAESKSKVDNHKKAVKSEKQHESKSNDKSAKSSVKAS